MTSPDSGEAEVPQEAAKGILARWRERFTSEPTGSDPLKLAKSIAVIVGAYLLVAGGLGMYWSSTPDSFEVR